MALPKFFLSLLYPLVTLKPNIFICLWVVSPIISSAFPENVKFSAFQFLIFFVFLFVNCNFLPISEAFLLFLKQHCLHYQLGRPNVATWGVLLSLVPTLYLFGLGGPQKASPYQRVWAGQRSTLQVVMLCYIRCSKPSIMEKKILNNFFVFMW